MIWTFTMKLNLGYSFKRIALALSKPRGRMKNKTSSSHSCHLPNQDIPIKNLCCDAQLEVSLFEGEGDVAASSADSCPECATRKIRLMKIAARTLERRAAELEIKLMETPRVENKAASMMRRKDQMLCAPSSNRLRQNCESEGRTKGTQKDEINELVWGQ